MSEPSGAPATVRVATSRPPLRVAVVATTALLLVAIVKPWSPATTAPPPAAAVTPAAAGPSGGERRSAVRSAAPTSSATAEAVPGPGEMTCQVDDWQIVSLDRLAQWTVRTWTPAAAILATGPLDASIPSVRLDSPRVLALGVCGPSTDAAGTRPPATVASIWRVGARRAEDVTFEPLAAAPEAGPRPGVAALYRPTRDRSAWPPGHYVVAIDVMGPAGDGAGRAFLGFDVPGPQ